MRLLPVCSISLSSFFKYDNIFSSRNKLVGAVALLIFSAIALGTRSKYFFKNHSFSKMLNTASKQWSLCKQYLFDRTPSNRRTQIFKEELSQTDNLVPITQRECQDGVPKDVARELFPLGPQKTGFSPTRFFTPNPRISPLDEKKDGPQVAGISMKRMDGNECPYLIIDKRENNGVLTGVTHIPTGQTAIGEFHDGLLWKGIEVSHREDGGWVAVIAQRMLNDKKEVQYVGSSVVVDPSSSSVRCDLPNGITLKLDLNRQFVCVYQGNVLANQINFSDLVRKQ